MERLIGEAGGKRIYVETSTQQGYATTRSFYERFGYTPARLFWMIFTLQETERRFTANRLVKLDHRPLLPWEVKESK
ncbi:MAG: hypothetical protein RBR67_05585 [Desulfobacterium sp.]|nr:hypothetical protein [Desulfobacterium sp.]